MNPVGEFRLSDAEGATPPMADAGETLRLQYHRGTHLWRALLKGAPTGKASLQQRREQSLRYQGQRTGHVAFSVLFCF